MWHQPAHFDVFRAELEFEGYRVYSPRLHRGNVANDVAAVQRQVDACERPPALIGHSYGGAVIGQVSGARAMMFVAAFVLRTGESCAGTGGTPKLAPAILTDLDGKTRIDPDRARKYLYADCSPDEAVRAIRLLTTQTSGHGRTDAVAERWTGVPTRYVVCADDQALDVEVQRRMANRCSSQVELHSGHSPFIAQPGALAAELWTLST